MKEENSRNMSDDECARLSQTIEKAKRALDEKRPNDENLSLGTLEYLKKYRIDT